LILIYLGFLSVKEFFREAAAVESNSGRLFKSSFITGYVLAISSPMTIVWWTGVFGALLTAQTGRQTSFSAFWSCLSILLGCFLWVVFLATALHWGKRIINDKMVKNDLPYCRTISDRFRIYFYQGGILMMS